MLTLTWARHRFLRLLQGVTQERLLQGFGRLPSAAPVGGRLSDLTRRLKSLQRHSTAAANAHIQKVTKCSGPLHPRRKQGVPLPILMPTSSILHRWRETCSLELCSGPSRQGDCCPRICLTNAVSVLPVPSLARGCQRPCMSLTSITAVVANGPLHGARPELPRQCPYGEIEW